MRSAAFVAAMLFTAACNTGAGGGDTTAVSQAGTTSAAEKAAVQASIDSSLALFVDALKRGDAATMASAYTDDAMVMAPGAKAASGREAIIALNNGMFSAMTFSDAAIRTTDLIVTGDYAIETGTYEMTSMPKNTKAAKPTRDAGKYLAVWRRQPNGSWKMIRDIFNSDMGT